MSASRPDPTIGIVVFPNAEELDFVGPWEAFAMAKRAAAGGVESADPANPSPELGVHLIAQSRDAVRCAKGLRVVPDFAFDEAPALDVVLVPGGQGTRREVENEALLGWLRQVAPRCTWVTSVCTGSLILAGAGLARAKRVTTHWAFVPELRKRYPDTTVLERVRYVRDGNLVTAAGVSAGIDMSLWVVGQIYGVEHARITQRMMEYDPAPPYSADV